MPSAFNDDNIKKQLMNALLLDRLNITGSGDNRRFGGTINLGSGDYGLSLTGGFGKGQKRNLAKASAFMPLFGGQLEIMHIPNQIRGNSGIMVGDQFMRGKDLYSVPQKYNGIQWTKHF